MFNKIFSSTSIAEKKFHHPYIDGLRGIAVLMVLLVHTSQNVGNNFVGSFNSRIIEDFVNAGARGVQLFFILSAFTLFSSSRARYEKDLFPKIDFYLRRGFRILPFWILMVIFMAFVSGAMNDFGRIIKNITFAFGFLRFDPNIELVSPAWSLFVEETFYLMLPFIFLYIRNIYRAYYLFLLTLALAVFWPVLVNKIGIPTSNNFVSLFPFSQWFAFAIGIILYFVISENKYKSVFRDSPKNLFVLDTMTFILIAISLNGNHILATLSMVFIFISSVYEKSIWGRITRNKILMKYGIYCYSIYLFHTILLVGLEPLRNIVFSKLSLNDQTLELKLMVWFPIVAIISYCLAFLTFNIIEKPCVNLGKKVIPKVNNLILNYHKRK